MAEIFHEQYITEYALKTAKVFGDPVGAPASVRPRPHYCGPLDRAETTPWP